jgi:hypothetical protein
MCKNLHVLKIVDVSYMLMNEDLATLLTTTFRQDKYKILTKVMGLC